MCCSMWKMCEPGEPRAVRPRVMSQLLTTLPGGLRRSARRLLARLAFDQPEEQLLQVVLPVPLVQLDQAPDVEHRSAVDDRHAVADLLHLPEDVRRIDHALAPLPQGLHLL